MATSPSYRAFVLDQLSRVAPGIRDRAMFGGVGIYAGDLFFGLIGNDVLYLKVDDGNRGDFEAVGMGPFRPFGDGGEVMQYYQVPPDVLEEPEQLRDWAAKAIDVARRARQKKQPARKSAKPSPRKKGKT
jgi:DNA transformation protein and related proteins